MSQYGNPHKEFVDMTHYLVYKSSHVYINVEIIIQTWLDYVRKEVTVKVFIDIFTSFL